MNHFGNFDLRVTQTEEYHTPSRTMPNLYDSTWEHFSPPGGLDEEISGFTSLVHPLGDDGASFQQHMYQLETVSPHYYPNALSSMDGPMAFGALNQERLPPSNEQASQQRMEMERMELAQNKRMELEALPQLTAHQQYELDIIKEFSLTVAQLAADAYKVSMDFSEYLQQYRQLKSMEV
jgi:hypothetical protein